MESINNFSNFIKNVEITKKGNTVKFTIQPIPKDRYDEAADHMCKFFLADEPLCECENLVDDSESVEEFRSLFLKALEDNLSIAAFFENPKGGKPIIAGMNVLFLGGKGERVDFSNTICKSKKVARVMEIMGMLSEGVDVEKIYGCKNYLGCFGLSVDPSFRGNSLGYHLLAARNEVGRWNNISATYTVFTSPISTKLGIDAGFEVLSTTLRHQIVDENGELLTPKCKTEIFRCMGMRLV
ncbi:uncharacterized protein LOC122509692 [Leptopilina heterotoma]|uniref:uncharacterized protein LOC122509692 n=1 Tax=Leptopilina heterotoma TaxID=63436 RepID=UPI001CA873C1|nr:uncharacterized protein LOC122509692 [Leptopilina heterotoma]